ncbi:hypothetical protein GQ42DRAFT_147409 [Ramicandelaber brevisporus]|nr:hypothetical protein GQ42DRAFT_147409 [Ramicandelaber brevisporus]
MAPPRNQESIQPPRKVIRALYDYNAEGADELSFRAGDFFHVVGDEDDEYWYEAYNPLTKQRGLVPVAFFQSIERRAPSTLQPVSSVSASGGPGGAKPHENVYGIVLFDFTAERPDELSAKSGEPIIIIAQSDHEWYVAKPIGRLGGPGLIPIAYVEVRDVQTGQAVDDLGEMLRRNNIKLMGVEEWRMHTLSQLKQNEQPAASSGANILHSTDVSAAGVSNFISRDGVYFFKVEISLIDGRHRVLYRQYEDFYDFQIALLNQFPRESGRTGERRTLPFMPGPAAFVNEMVTMQRKLDLDKYIQDMFRQPNYIVDAEPFQSFLSQLSQIPPHQTPSASTSQSRITSQQQSQQQTVIKAKIMFQDDILAMKLPVNLTYGMLCEKIGQRLGLNQIASISYRDSSGNFVHLGDDVDLERALDSDPFRIMLSVMPM